MECSKSRHTSLFVTLVCVVFIIIIEFIITLPPLVFPKLDPDPLTHLPPQIIVDVVAMMLLENSSFPKAIMFSCSSSSSNSSYASP